MAQAQATPSIRDTLQWTCKATADEIERIGKRTPRRCGECESCKRDGEKGGAFYCEARSDFPVGEPARLFLVDPDGYNDSEEVGTYIVHSSKTEPCEEFYPKSGFAADEFHEDAHAWVAAQLEVMYVVNSRGDYQSGIVVTGVGGPHVELDTGAGEVRGRWGCDAASAWVSGDAIYAIDEALEECYESVRMG